jgi:hypothetical protein
MFIAGFVRFVVTAVSLGNGSSGSDRRAPATWL